MPGPYRQFACIFTVTGGYSGVGVAEGVGVSVGGGVGVRVGVWVGVRVKVAVGVREGVGEGENVRVAVTGRGASGIGVIPELLQ
uniref:Uncharacterized protein n=1 Tax=Anaerolinea thermolimosa TaxID=229919 RepID=A0A7C4KG45_9CHLR